MNNPLAEHIYRILGQKHGETTKVEFLAELIVASALKGDMVAARICFDMLETFDSSLADVDMEED